MKRFVLGVTILGAAAVLGGCPIYSGPDSCPNGTFSDGTCIQPQCQTSADCGSGLSCNSYNVCVPTYVTPEAGNCPTVRCPTGYVCELAANGAAPQCVLLGQPGPVGDGGVAMGRDGAAPDGTVVTEDARAASDAPPDGRLDAAVGPCNANGDCAGGRCIDGQCTPVSQLCSDTTQCVSAGEACVDGVCEPHCSASAPCPGGYGCDFTRGVCNLNPTPCVGTGTSTCNGGGTCVEGHCVPPCPATDSGPSCPGGQVCVNGGCIPDEAAVLTCRNDGQSGPLATKCAASEICVHHSCYAACVPPEGGVTDAGSSSSCTAPGGVCKQVTVSAGTYAVCGTTTNLGNDCDPATAKLCPTGEVCIDGFCK